MEKIEEPINAWIFYFQLDENDGNYKEHENYLTAYDKPAEKGKLPEYSIGQWKFIEAIIAGNVMPEKLKNGKQVQFRENLKAPGGRDYVAPKKARFESYGNSYGDIDIRNDKQMQAIPLYSYAQVPPVPVVNNPNQIQSGMNEFETGLIAFGVIELFGILVMICVLIICMVGFISYYAGSNAQSLERNALIKSDFGVL